MIQEKKKEEIIKVKYKFLTPPRITTQIFNSTVFHCKVTTYFILHVYQQL